MKISTTLLRQSFPFVTSPKAKILILGSMPGERSLQEQQYYAHPKNIFWEIIGDLFGADRQLTYKKRLQILSQNGVALWDVAFQCHRPGSLDTSIRMESVVPNDFASLFSRCPKIDTIFFNGQKAEQLFRKLVLEKLVKNLGKRAGPLRFLRLPSTSPAHASLTRGQKKARWHQELKAALAPSQPSYYVYILQAGDGRYYTGYTTHLDRRLKEHQSGSGGKFTRSFGAIKILYHEVFSDQSSALKREAEIKGWSRKEKEALIMLSVELKITLDTLRQSRS